MQLYKNFVIIFIQKEINKKLNKRDKRALAKQIAKLEKQQGENNISENEEKIEQLIKDCSIQDLLDIDELIMKKYLTN